MIIFSMAESVCIFSSPQETQIVPVQLSDSLHLKEENSEFSFPYLLHSVPVLYHMFAAGWIQSFLALLFLSCY